MRIFALWVLWLSLALPIPAAVAEETPPSQTTAEDQGFLQLPAYELERMGKDPAQVGDQIRFKIVGFREKGVQLVPAPGSEALADLGWAILPLQPDSPTPGAASSDFQFMAIPLKKGELRLPPLSLNLAQPVGRTQPVTLSVASAIRSDDPKPEEPEDLRPPVAIGFPWMQAVLLALAVLLPIAALLYFFRKRLRKPPAPIPAGPPLPEDEAALLALDQLEKSGLALRGEFKKHYFKASEILKVYLGGRYRFDAPESTSSEIITYLEDRKSVADEIVDRLESLLNRLDQVKFTDHVPPPEEPALIIQDVRQLVKQTRRLKEAHAVR